MAQDYQPDIEFEVSLWKEGESFGKLSLGLGINKNTRQLLFYFGKIVSDKEPGWWMVAERHLCLLDFFLDHKIYFDDHPDKPRERYRQRGSHRTYEIHFESDSYETFLKLLEAKVNQQSDKPGDWIPSRKMYSLIGILALILNYMDSDTTISEDEFEEKWNHFLDILEEEAIEK